MGRYDVMQVCRNGHVITENYVSMPEFRKDFCPECGQSTITKCVNCNSDIPGDYHVEGVFYLSDEEPIAPKICTKCGSKFPWYERVVNEAEARKLKREKKEMMKNMKGMKIEVKGHGNVVNLGDISDSTISNTVTIKKSVDDNLGKALEELTNAIEKADDIDDEMKKAHLEQLRTLSEQALLEEDKRLPKSVLEPMISFGLGALSSVGSVASIWGTWGDTIKSFFIG